VGGFSLALKLRKSLLPRMHAITSHNAITPTERVYAVSQFCKCCWLNDLKRKTAATALALKSSQEEIDLRPEVAIRQPLRHSFCQFVPLGQCVTRCAFESALSDCALSLDGVPH